jgi:hypothetical protein
MPIGPNEMDATNPGNFSGDWIWRHQFLIQLVKKLLQYFTEARLQVEVACSHRTVDRVFNR